MYDLMLVQVEHYCDKLNRRQEMKQVGGVFHIWMYRSKNLITIEPINADWSLQ